MALFKIEKGLAKNLENQRPTTHSGWCYFTIDDGKFYIDVADSTSVTLAQSNNDSSANRIPINAFYADRVSFTPRIKYIHNDSGELDLQIVTGEKYESGKIVENSSGYLEFPVADSEKYGIVSTKEQVFSGAKTFLASPVFTQGIKLKGVGTNGADSFVLSQQAETTTNKGDLYFFTGGNNNLYHNSSENQILTQKNYSNLITLPIVHQKTMTYGVQTAQKPAFGGTFDIPYLTVDVHGRVTGGNTVTVTIPSATASTSANGLMTSAMVTKLNGIETGAEVNQNAYGKISDGTNTTTAAQEQDTITFKGSHLRVTVLNNEVTYELTQGNIQDLIGETMTKTEIDAAIDAAINGLIDGAPGTLNTLNEIAAALKDNPDTVTAIIEDLGKKVNKAGDTMTGTLTLTNSTSALSATGPASFKSTVTFEGTTSFSDTITAAGNIVPNVNNSVNLGSSSKKWATVYATKFDGKATSADAADVATKVSNALTINGLTYDGSAAKNVGTIGVAYGGTGKTEWTANRIIYSSGKTTLANATNMYISNTQLGVNVTTAPSTGIALQVGGNIAANADNTYTLGTDGYKWATVYATTFSGNATSANKVNHKFTVNGTDFDGSSDQDAGVIATAYGGTGNDAYTADQLIYSSTATKLSGATGLWSNGSALTVGATSSTYLAALEAYTFSVAGASQFDGATYISSTGTLIVQNTATSTGSTASSFAVQIDGGVCIEQNLRVKKAAYFSSSITASSSISASGLYLSSSYAYLYYSDTSNGVNSQLNFRVYRKIPTASGASTYQKSSRYETYYLDATNDSYGTTSTGNVGSYKILSTKSTITVGQGGTGKTSWTANRLIYSSATTTLANTTNIYVNTSQMNIGGTTAPSSDITLKVSGNTSAGGYVAPNTDNTYTSGTADYKWSTVYATTFSGNATSANKVNNTFKVNGIEFDGSVAKDAGVIGTAYGGTGNDTYVVNHLIWSSSATKLDDSAGIWTDGTRLALGVTTNPNVFGTYVFYVKGASHSDGAHTVSGEFTAKDTATFEDIVYVTNTTDVTTETLGNTNKSGSVQIDGGVTISKHLKANGKIYIPSAGVSWKNGGIMSNAAIAILANQSENSYHPYFYTKTYNGHVFTMGGLTDKVGFYGYTSSKLAENETVTDGGSYSWATTWDVSTGNITHNKQLKVSYTADSTSTTTGALVSSGGLGVAKAVNIGTSLKVGTSLDVTGAATLNSTLTVTGNFTTSGISTMYHTNPATDNTYNLGGSSKRWANIYGTQIYGALNGNASTATLLALHNTITSSVTRSIATSSWNGSISGVTYMWGQSFKDSAISSDTGDLVLAVRAGQYTTGGTELCIAIDGDYYSMGNKVLHAGNYSTYALPLAGGTMNGTIWSTHIYPKTTMTYNLGSTSYEYNAIFGRTIFVRHLEPAKNISNDIYLNYNTQNGCVRVYSSMSMEGLSNIVNLPIGGGIFWNPYVESAEDNTDAASITLHANGVGGGTELRITMANDGDDVINLNPAAWIYLKGKATFRVEDNWLRINETSEFSAGIYTGSSLIRSDNCLQVGDSGSAFLARDDGYGKFSTRLDIGSKLSLWQDGEGGNIQITSGTDHTNAWQIDSYNGNLRFFTYRESDGAIQENYLDQNTGYINCANYAGYTMRWDVTASNPTTTSTDNCTSYFNQPGSHVYWYSAPGLINGQPSTYGYILDIGSYAERHQIWMTQISGSLYHRAGNFDGWASDGWKEILDSVNYSSYTVPKSGGTFTGTVTINNGNSSGYLQLSEDGEGGTIRMAGPNASYIWEMDSHNNSIFRIFTNGSGSYKFFVFDGASGAFSAPSVYGAVWNDYAEYRSAETIEPGRVVQESADGIMKLTTHRLAAGCEIISDTFGFAIGETDNCKTPVATTGRVLAYTFEDRDSFKLGQAVCSGPNGTVSKMTREEIMMYPERIIGTVSEIPTYTTWGTGNVDVNGRIWIRIR